MNGKDIQKEIIKTYLKPVLKEWGYSTSGQIWWKMKGEFFIVIHLQNSQWNSADHVSFCFNIGVGLTARLQPNKKPPVSLHDILTRMGERAYLSEERVNHKYREGSSLSGYLITNQTSTEDFIRELRIDFEEEILPKLNALQTMEDCIAFYRPFPVWGKHLEKAVALSRS